MTPQIEPDTEIPMKRLIVTTAMAAYLTVGVAMAATANPLVGGNPMLASRNVVENAVNSKAHTTLVAAVKAGGLVDTLASAGPFTVFAPTNAAFAGLPAGTVDKLLMPGNKKMLVHVLTYHAVPGTHDSADLMARIKAGGGAATLKTASGDTLTLRMNGPANVVVEDADGGTANISTYDVMQSNGVIHVVDSVLHPKM